MYVCVKWCPLSLWASIHLTFASKINKTIRVDIKVKKFQECPNYMPRTESLAMTEAVPVSGRVRNVNVYEHVNKVSHYNW